MDFFSQAYYKEVYYEEFTADKYEPDSNFTIYSKVLTEK